MHGFLVSNLRFAGAAQHGDAKKRDRLEGKGIARIMSR